MHAVELKIGPFLGGGGGKSWSKSCVKTGPSCFSLFIVPQFYSVFGFKHKKGQTLDQF